MTPIKAYKLTDQNLETRGGFQWREGIWAPKLTGQGGLCGPGFYHACQHPLLAEFLNPIHANFPDPILWEAEGRGVEENDNGLKLGFSEMRIISRMDLVKPTTVQRVSFALLCAKEVYKEASFVEFADKYLKGEDRAEKSAREAAAWAAWGAAAWDTTAREAARAAAWAAAWEAREAEAREAEARAWAAAWEAREAEAREAEARAWAAWEAREAEARAWGARGARDTTAREAPREAARAAAWAARANNFSSKLIWAAEEAMKIQ